MTTKRASQAWLLMLIVSINIFIFLSHFEISWIEKTLLLLLDVGFVVSSRIFFKGSDSKNKTILFFIIILPVLYLAARYRVGVLQEPLCWFILIKSLLQCFLVFSSQQSSESRDNKIIFYAPLVLILLLNLFYILGNYAAPIWDQARHGINSFKVFHSLLNEGIINTWMFYDFYASLGYLFTAPFQMVFGSNYDALVLSILLFWFPIGYYFTYKIFREVFKINNGYESFLNFAFHSNVMLLSLLKQFLMDYQMISLLAVQFYLIFKSEKFTNNKFLILNGLVCGIGFMVKESYPLYAFMLIGPYIVWIARSEFLTADINKWISFYMKAVLAGLFIGIIVVPWFTGWGYMFIWEMKGSGSYETTGLAEGDPYPYSIASFTWYFKALIYYYTWPILLILTVGWFSFFRKKEQINIGLVFVSGLAVIWLIFTLLWNKDYRYFMPAIFFFIPAFVGLAQLKQKLSIALVSILTFFSLYINFAQAYSKGINYPSMNIEIYASPTMASAYINSRLSAAVACSLLQKHGVTNLEWINKDSGDPYGSSFYFEQFGVHPGDLKAPLDSAHTKKEIFTSNEYGLYGYFDKYDKSEYVLFRDSLYPTYYLYQFLKQEDKLTIREIGHHGKFTGDVKFIINSKEKSDTILFREQTVLDIEPSEKISIKANLYHSHGRWPLIYRKQFVGDVPLSDLSLTPYTMLPLKAGLSNSTFTLN